MKKLFAIGAVMVLALRLTAFAVAGEKPDLGSSEKYNRAELNLLIGLQSDNLGLRESSAYMLGELKSGKAVIPLMHMLRQDEHESSRVVAALALCQIGDARGAFAVKRAAKFDESSRVQARCAWFYDQYVSPGTFNFVAIGMPESVDMAAK
jgi:HEAT repeat protein